MPHPVLSVTNSEAMVSTAVESVPLMCILCAVNFESSYSNGWLLVKEDQQILCIKRFLDANLLKAKNFLESSKNSKKNFLKRFLSREDAKIVFKAFFSSRN